MQSRINDAVFECQVTRIQNTLFSLGTTGAWIDFSRLTHYPELNQSCGGYGAWLIEMTIYTTREMRQPTSTLLN